MPLLQVSNLTISTKNETLVHGVSFEIGQSEIVSIVGESGSGKSLSCLSILNLLPKTLKAEGSIIFDDKGQSTELLHASSKIREMASILGWILVFDCLVDWLP